MTAWAKAVGAAVLASTCAATLGACSGAGGADRSSSPTASGVASTPTTQQARFDGHTSCRSVTYVGESTSVGMVSTLQVPNAAERLEARMKDVGVKRLRVDVSGGRSSIERFMNRPSSVDVITPAFAKNFRGCYVMAFGVNDAANSSFVNSAGTARQRIDLVMKRVGGRPVLWTTAATSPALRGPYADSNMQRYDHELLEATKRYPNLRLYDWRAEADPAWREPDGIHDVRRGSRERALMYSRALAVAFPRGLPTNTSTVVGSAWGKPATAKNRPALPAATGDADTFWAADTKALALYTSGPTNP